MNRVCQGFLLFLAIVATIGCGSADGTPAAPAAAETGEPSKTREPAVAGLFYPRHEDDLTKQVNGFLADAETVPLGKLRGLVCPHAGYDFSGPTAAIAYKQLAGRDIETVVVLAPSHYADFEGASVPNVESYSTPLGTIPLSPRAAELVKHPPFCRNPECDVQRPGWWRQASKELPPFGEDTPHTWEHSLEVQLPFLQTVLGEFQLVPAVLRQADGENAAKALAQVIDDKTLIVASSDLSHYYPYNVAEQLDASCVRAICHLDVKWMQNEEACGKLPVLTLMHLARQKGWKTKLLDYRNSGDTSGDRSRVVGYAAIAFYEGNDSVESDETEQRELTTEEQAFLLDLARTTLVEAVTNKKLPEVDYSEVPERLRERGACFVTLNKDDQLRGCIGHIFACRELYLCAMENAVQAALADRRFQPVEADELDDIEIEVSVLTTPECVEFDSSEDLLAKLRPGTDGVVFGIRGRRSTYLPQVWEQIPDKEEFLGQLVKKADPDLEPTAWKDPDAAFLTYQVQAFHEEIQRDRRGAPDPAKTSDRDSE